MQLETLLAECSTYDFKEMLEEKRPKSWLKSVSAFANGIGGSLFFGIDNAGNIKGIDNLQHVCEVKSISNKLKTNMNFSSDTPNSRDVSEFKLIRLQQKMLYFIKNSLIKTARQISEILSVSNLILNVLHKRGVMKRESKGLRWSLCNNMQL